VPISRRFLFVVILTSLCGCVYSDKPVGGNPYLISDKYKMEIEGRWVEWKKSDQFRVRVVDQKNGMLEVVWGDEGSPKRVQLLQGFPERTCIDLKGAECIYQDNVFANWKNSDLYLWAKVHLESQGLASTGKEGFSLFVSFPEQFGFERQVYEMHLRGKRMQLDPAKYQVGPNSINLVLTNISENLDWITRKSYVPIDNEFFEYRLFTKWNK
jgi:hypothetical protein